MSAGKQLSILGGYKKMAETKKGTGLKTPFKDAVQKPKGATVQK